MFFKILLFIAAICLIYIVFFRKQPQKTQNNAKNSDETMVECASCKTFISSNEAIKKGKDSFCSIECLTKKG
jgi:uncharacterized protein